MAESKDKKPSSKLEGDALDRLAVLTVRGFEPLEAGPVHVIWERTIFDGGEGFVIKSAEGSYSAPTFKIKPQREFVAIAHRGHLHVLGPDGRPKAVGRCPETARGLVLVACEGATPHGKVRAPRIISPAPAGANASATQLERLVIK